MQSAKELAASQAIAKQVAETLEKHHPGHAWSVYADVMQGVVNIHNLNLSSEWGYVILMDEMINDPEMRMTIRAGGEILERFGINQGRLNHDELHGKPMDLRGNLKYDA